MKNLAIIPARAKSIRIPKKNIKPFLGKPIIAYSIEAAKMTNLFDEIMVSTDDKEIAEISIRYGAKVPFFRSSKTSDDYAIIPEVVEEVLNEYSKRGIYFDNICCILATAPFITPQRIISAYELMINKNYDSVLPIVRYSYPIQRALKIVNEKVIMFEPENYTKRSQDLEPAYYDSGQFYWMRVSEFIKQKRFFANNTGAIILSQLEAHDIDTEEDWTIAELKYKILKNEVQNY